MKRVPTGVPGLDELIEGGFPESSSILLSGGAGCGKSIFCLEYLYNGAREHDETGVYITLEEGPHNLWWNMQRFKWDLLPLEKNNKLKIYKFEPSLDFKENTNDQIQRIIDKAKQLSAKRMVIDSITAFSFWMDDVGKIRYAIYALIEALRKLDCTTILTCETTGGKNSISRFGVEEFLTDGVIQLLYTPPHRSMFVRKMRGTNHDKRVHPVEISDAGFQINSKEEILWEALRD
ncbi:AAA family ATPase [Candidatus Micrarchaeota archaeon]|nr:AAA family ATPase [Candidatus Micrarchaeota archaeon]